MKPDTPTLIEWDEHAFVLGVADMDATHSEFIDLLNRLNNAADATFPALFKALLEHTQMHFESEEARMLLCGFPAISEHTNEHRRVLGELTRIKKRVDRGLISFGRMYVRQSLPDWFRLHAATMDSALAAHWIHHQSSGPKQA
jgi:hemerythrin-like metal-binding protein